MLRAESELTNGQIAKLYNKLLIFSYTVYSSFSFTCLGSCVEKKKTTISWCWSCVVKRNDIDIEIESYLSLLLSIFNGGGKLRCVKWFFLKV